MLHKCLITLLLLVPGVAYAHAGHGHIDSRSIWHALMEWEHSGLLLAAVIVLLPAVITWRIIARRTAGQAANEETR